MTYNIMDTYVGMYNFCPYKSFTQVELDHTDPIILSMAKKAFEECSSHNYEMKRVEDIPSGTRIKYFTDEGTIEREKEMTFINLFTGKVVIHDDLKLFIR